METTELYNFFIKTLGNNQVIVNVNNTSTFFSYETKVITIDIFDNKLILHRGFDYSVTTNKYTNQFLVGLSVATIKKALSKKETTVTTDNNETYTIIDERNY